MLAHDESSQRPSTRSTSPYVMSSDFEEQEEALEREYLADRRRAAKAAKKHIVKRFSTNKPWKARYKRVKEQMKADRRKERREERERKEQEAPQRHVDEKVKDLQKHVGEEVKEIQQKKREEERSFLDEAKSMGTLLLKLAEVPKTHRWGMRDPKTHIWTYSTERADIQKLLTQVHNHMTLTYLGVANASFAEGPTSVQTPVPTVKDQLEVYQSAENLWNALAHLSHKTKIPHLGPNCLICDTFPNDEIKQRALHSHITRRLVESTDFPSLSSFLEQQLATSFPRHPLKLCSRHQQKWRPITSDKNVVRLEMSVTVHDNIEELRPRSISHLVNFLQHEKCNCEHQKIPGTASLYHAVLHALKPDTPQSETTKEAKALEARVLERVLMDKYKGGASTDSHDATSLQYELELEMIHLAAEKHCRLLVRHPDADGTWSKYEPVVQEIPHALDVVKDALKKPLPPTSTVVLLEYLPKRYDVLMPTNGDMSWEWALAVVQKFSPETAGKFDTEVRAMLREIYAPVSTEPKTTLPSKTFMEQRRLAMKAAQRAPRRVPPPRKDTASSVVNPQPHTRQPSMQTYPTRTPAPSKKPPISAASSSLPIKTTVQPSNGVVDANGGETYIGRNETEFRKYMEGRGFEFQQASGNQAYCLFYAVNNALVGFDSIQEVTSPVMPTMINDDAAARDLVDEVIKVQQEARNADNPLYRRANGSWVFDKENGFGEESELRAIAYVRKIRIIVFRHERNRPYTRDPEEYTMLSRNPLQLTPDMIKATIVISCHYPDHYDSYVMKDIPKNWTDAHELQQGTLERVRIISPHLYDTLSPLKIRKEYFKLQSLTINLLPCKVGLEYCKELLVKDKEAAWNACKDLNNMLYAHVEAFADLSLESDFAEKVGRIKELLDVKRWFRALSVEDKEKTWSQYRDMVERLLDLKTLYHERAKAEKADTPGINEQIKSLLTDIERQPWGGTFLTDLRAKPADPCKSFLALVKDWHRSLRANNAEGFVIDLQIPWTMTLNEALDALEAYVCEFRISQKYGQEREEKIQNLLQKVQVSDDFTSNSWDAISEVFEIMLQLKMANILADNKYVPTSMDSLWDAWQRLQPNMGQQFKVWRGQFQAHADHADTQILIDVWKNMAKCVRDFINEKTRDVPTSETPPPATQPTNTGNVGSMAGLQDAFVQIGNVPDLSVSTHGHDHGMASSSGVSGHNLGAGASSSSGLQGAFAGTSSSSTVPPRPNLTSAFESTAKTPEPTAQDDVDNRRSQIHSFLEKLKRGKAVSVNDTEWKDVQTNLTKLSDAASDEEKKQWKMFADDVKITFINMREMEKVSQVNSDSVTQEEFVNMIRDKLNVWFEQTNNPQHKSLIKMWSDLEKDATKEIIDDLLRQLTNAKVTPSSKRRRTEEVLNQDSNMGALKREPIDLDASDSDQ